MENVYKKRARRKYFNEAIIQHLVDLGSNYESKYKDTLLCSGTIKVTNGKATSRYCKHRWCGICNPIRTAIRIKAYSPVLETLGELAHTCVSVPNVPIELLATTIQAMKGVFRQFRNTLKKKTGFTFQGMYTVEVTYSPRLKNYHPHIHIIHKQYGNVHPTGQLLIDYWLKKFPKAGYKGQDTGKLRNMLEGFKYVSKPSVKYKIDGIVESFIPVRELDAIFQSIEGIRTFGAYGIKGFKAEVEDVEFKKLEVQELTETHLSELRKKINTEDEMDGFYTWTGNDWRNNETMVYFSGYEPTEKQKNTHRKYVLNANYS